MRYQVQTSYLKEHVDRHGIGVSTLATILGVNQKRMRQILKGDASPNVYEAVILADVLFVKDIRTLWDVKIVEGFDVTE